jgi:hypothetical protein
LKLKKSQRFGATMPSWQYSIVYPESRCRLSFFKPRKGERKITVEKYYIKKPTCFFGDLSGNF